MAPSKGGQGAPELTVWNEAGVKKPTFFISAE